MEGIVAEGARHMARTGDFAVPHLYGQIYAFKPPLTYWLVWASFELFGCENEWTLRFPVALCGFLMGLGVLAIFARRLGPRTACLCALASLTGAIVIQKIRIAEFDMPLAAGVGIAIAVACANLSAKRENRVLWLVGYAALAFGFLAKGVPAVMAYAPGLLIAALITRKFRRLVSPAHLVGLLCFLVPVGLWLMCAYQAHGSQAFEHPLAEARARGFDWGWKAVGLTLIKPAVVMAVFLPWTVVLPVVLSKSWRRSLDDSAGRLIGAALSFLLIGILVFMAIPTPNPRYYLPLCVPLGILAGVAATANLVDFKKLRASRHIASLICLAFLLVASIIICIEITNIHIQPFPRAALTVLACSMAVVFVLAIRRRDDKFLASTLILSALCFGAIEAWVLCPHRTITRSQRQVARILDAHLPNDVTIWTTTRDDYSSLFFYLDRPVQHFSIQTGKLPPNTFVVIFADQLSRLQARSDLKFTIIERVSQHGHEYTLIRTQ